MAYETGAATDLDDLISKIVAFAVANGWTQDQLALASNQAAISKGTMFFAFRWDTTNGTIGLYHALGYTPGNLPGNHPDDSGNGVVNATITTGRRLIIGAGPFTAYHLFSGTNHIHVVVELSPGLFRSFSMGTLNKVGTWTGGEYLTHIYWASSAPDTIAGPAHHVLFDLLSTAAAGDCGTIHIEGMPSEGGASKWGVLFGGTVGTRGNDRAGNARVDVCGTFREGFFHNPFCGFAANPSSGFIPMAPVMVFYRNRGVSPEDWYFLGSAPDIRFINIRNIIPGEEIIVGADTWKCFPWIRRSALGGGIYESKYQGIAFKKVV